MASVMFRIGDILESGADLTALPCSTKGHISATAQARVDRFGLPLPSAMPIGAIEIRRFPGRVSRIIAWASSVENRSSDPAAIRDIGERLGTFANDNPWVQILEAPLLGTGAGKLDPLKSGPALRDGFLATCKTDALLIIYGQIATTMHQLRGLKPADDNEAGDDNPPTSRTSSLTPIAAAPGAPSVFISYSHKDRKFLDQLRTHLKPLERIAVVDAWSDKQIDPGSEWFPDIEAALGRAKVAVLLVTPSFLASDFIHEHELTPILKKAGSKGVKILWIPVRACSYNASPIAKYQAVIPPEKPLAEMKVNRDKAWVKVCEAIQKAVDGHATR